MNVKQLISKLKKMPQTAQVGFRDHDASSHEISSWVMTVSILDKNDEPLPEYADKWEQTIYNDLPEIVVVLSG